MINTTLKLFNVIKGDDILSAKILHGIPKINSTPKKSLFSIAGYDDPKPTTPNPVLSKSVVLSPISTHVNSPMHEQRRFDIKSSSLFKSLREQSSVSLALSRFSKEGPKLSYKPQHSFLDKVQPEKLHQPIDQEVPKSINNAQESLADKFERFRLKRKGLPKTQHSSNKRVKSTDMNSLIKIEE